MMGEHWGCTALRQAEVHLAQAFSASAVLCDAQQQCLEAAISANMEPLHGEAGLPAAHWLLRYCMRLVTHGDHPAGLGS